MSNPKARMNDNSLQDRIDDATFDFTIGDGETAIAKLTKLTDEHPDSPEAWHALAEVQNSDGHHEEALKSAEAAHNLRPDDLHINVSLSRIWVALGDKEKAEHYGAQARMLGWKEELKNPPSKEEDE